MVEVTGEFAAIAAIQHRLPGPPGDGQVWIGDDAAVLPATGPGWLLFAVDTVVGGVHADLALTGIDDLGWKAMTSSVSDLAAMGGEPGHAVISVAGPPGTDLPALYDGLSAAALEYGCPIVGGDLTNADTLVVTVAVTGYCPESPVLRSGARAGDDVWVTGPLGASAAGLRTYRAEAGQRAPEDDLSPVERTSLLAAHARPRALLAAGRAARRAGATAMIDVSDGLAADLGHISEMSGVGVRLETVPVARGATLEEALGGGEDFVLAFCAPPAAEVGLSFDGLSLPVRIGTCTADREERTLSGRPLPAAGWQHRW
jgi:thiamine-monophosphate kinase